MQTDASLPNKEMDLTSLGALHPLADLGALAGASARSSFPDRQRHANTAIQFNEYP